MSDQEEWGPWIEHDGRGCPVTVGTHVYVRLRGGEEYTAVAGCGYAGGQYMRPHGRENEKGLSRWVAISSPTDIIRYRIRKPRGMAVLEALLHDLPEEIDA